MTTKRETIVSRLATTLASTTGVSGRVYRSRVEPFAAGEFPCLLIESVSDSPNLNSIGSIVWNFIVRVTVFTRGDVPDNLADSMVEDIHARIMADTTLGGHCVDIMPGSVNFDMTEGDQPICLTQLDYQLDYYTTKTSISG